MKENCDDIPRKLIKEQTWEGSSLSLGSDTLKRAGVALWIEGSSVVALIPY